MSDLKEDLGENLPIVTKILKKIPDKAIKILLLIAIWVFLLVLIGTLITILKYKEIIITDALNYGMNNHNFTNCVCFDEQGRDWWSLNKSGFVHREETGFNLGGISDIKV